MFLYLEESGDPNIGVCLQEVLQLELKVKKTQRYDRSFFAIASKIMSVKFVLNTQEIFLKVVHSVCDNFM